MVKASEDIGQFMQKVVVRAATMLVHFDQPSVKLAAENQLNDGILNT